jgi:hypothetical protein
MSESETPFRLYTTDERGQPVHLTSYDQASVGDGLLYWHRRGVTIRGILYRLFDDLPGEWLMNPWEQPVVASGRLDRATTESTEEESHE